jgi:hypothetical protein
MVMKKTFWLSAVFAMLLIAGSYGTNHDFKPISEIGTAALEMSGLSTTLGGTTSFALNMFTQYFIVMGVIYFFLRTVAKSFKD